MSTIFDTFIAPPCHDEIETLYQDEHLVLINKPSGLLSLSGKIRRISIRYITGWYRFTGCTLVHRLDFGTSGLMVVARNKAINAALCQQFSQRTITKVYSALLCGHLENDEGVIDAAIAKDPALFPLMSICALNGKPALALSGCRAFYHRQEEGTLLPLTRVQLTLKPGAPINYGSIVSSWDILFWGVICTVDVCCRGLNKRHG